ncbi:MAG: hypothetical protein U1F11_05775 [Steroidobacteraceae bacterium]
MPWRSSDRTGPRVEAREPGARAEPEDAAVVDQQRSDARRCIARQGRGEPRTPARHPVGHGIDAIEPALARDPDAPVGILGEVQHRIVAERARVAEVAPVLPRGASHLVDHADAAAAGADPQPPGPVEAQRAHVALRIEQCPAGRAGDRTEMAARRIAHCHAAAIGRDIQVPARITADRRHPVVRQAARVLAIAHHVHDLVAVVVVEAVLGADPDEARGVLLDRGHAALRQSVIGSEAREQHLLRRGARRGARERHQHGEHDRQQQHERRRRQRRRLACACAAGVATLGRSLIRLGRHDAGVLSRPGDRRTDAGGHSILGIERGRVR